MESMFLTQQEDGTYLAQPCACHGAPPAPPPRIPAAISASPRRPPKRASKVKFCTDFEEVCEENCPCSSSASENEERKPLMSDHRHEEVPGPKAMSSTPWWHTALAGRDARGAMIGIFQGACCPLGMVGISFLATLPVPGIVVFLLTFMAVSAFGTAILAVCWAWVTSNGICGGLSPKFGYRVSCCLTLSLGILWIIANYCGFLEKLNYAEAAHHKVHMLAPTSATEHKQK